jgi:tetratricopeptide (TPR) repeat protein
VPARNRYERARRAARRAVELDPRSGEGWAVLGLVSLVADLDPGESLWHLDRAVDVAPGSSRAHHWRAWVLFLQGRPHAAEAALARARALDPLSPIVRTAQATLSHYSGRLGEARARCQEVLELQPDFARARLRLGLIAEQEGDFGTAERQLQIAARDLGDSEEALAALAHLYGRAGRHAERQRVLARLGERKLSPLSQAVIWLGAGDERRAIAALAEGVDQRRLLAIELVGDSRLEGIRHRLFDELPTLAGLPNRGQQVAAGHLVPWNP